VSGAQAAAAPRHLDALTGIRGIAAWLVVLYHIRLSLTGLLPGGIVAALGKGYLAVDLFFMLSGFVLWYNYADRLRVGGLAAAGDFLWRRIARVWPLHAFILAGFIALALAIAASGRDVSGYPLAELPMHVLLVQNWGMTGQLAWNHPAWSISTEMAAYLVFPLIVAAWRWDRLPASVLVGIGAALLGAIHLLFALNGDSTLGDEIPRLGVWRCLLEFALGNVLCMVWSRWNGQRLSAMLAAGICLAALASGLFWRLPETAFVPLVFASGLLALAFGRGPIVRVLGSGGLLYLGEISYSTYLAHFGLFILFKLVFVDASLQIGWLGLAGFLLLVLVSSMALYRFVEKPAQRGLNRHAPRRAVPDAVAAR
jgi:peptidoglycan/LPS O-acetylase OafA/YrhL